MARHAACAFQELRAKDRRAVVVRIEQEGQFLMIGVIVDGVDEVLSLTDADIEDTPDFGTGVLTPYIKGMAKPRRGRKNGESGRATHKTQRIHAAQKMTIRTNRGIFGQGRLVSWARAHAASALAFAAIRASAFFSSAFFFCSGVSTP